MLRDEPGRPKEPGSKLVGGYLDEICANCCWLRFELHRNSGVTAVHVVLLHL